MVFKHYLRLSTQRCSTSDGELGLMRLSILAILTIGTLSIGSLVVRADDGFRMTLSPDGAKCDVGGERFADLTSSLWAIETDAGEYASANSRNIRVTAAPGGDLISGTSNDLQWSAKCESIAPATSTITVTLKPSKPLTIRRVFLFNERSSLMPVVAKTKVQDIAAFYRDGERGLFASLDFPYCKIINRGGAWALSYPPFVRLAAGQEYVCHSYTLGATKPIGRERYGFYEGEVDAIDSYVQNRFRPKFDRPIFCTASIVNRYTQPERNWVFYTMKDHPTLSFNRDILKRELTLMGEIGIEFYQVFPGVFDWAPNDPSDAQVREAVEWAKQNNVRIGDYSGTNEVFCRHYNQHGNKLPPGMDACFGNRKFVDWYGDTVVNNARKYGFEMHCLDFLKLLPCNNPNHGHPLGNDSMYSQVRGLVEVMDRISAVSPNMLLWPNSGHWTQYLPKIVWHAPSQYLTDPGIRTPWPGLNMTRLLDDVRRKQMFDLHYSHFVPYRSFSNCQYFLSQNSPSPDIRNYKYGALATLAVTPNICPAEIRPWCDTLCERDKKEVIAFYRKWTKFMAENFALWEHTYHLGDDPNPGSVEIYGHAKDDHGFVFVVNPNYFSRKVAVPLDGTLGFSGSGTCEIVELYPWERLRCAGLEPTTTFGSKIEINAPSQTVTVLEIRPLAPISAPRLYGIPGNIAEMPDGYTVTTTGPQGRSERFAVVLPKDSAPVRSVSIEKVVPQLDRRQWNWDPTRLTIISNDGRTLVGELTFRRKEPTKDLSTWSVRSGSLEEGLQSNWNADMAGDKEITFPTTSKIPIKLSNFQAAYMENGFCEDQETILYLTANSAGPLLAATGKATTASLPASQSARSAASLDDKSHSWWLRSHFITPLAQCGGFEGSANEHTLIVLPFKDQDQLDRIQAWINGQPVDIRTYRYSLRPALSCRYIDIVGAAIKPGRNELVIFVHMK